MVVQRQQAPMPSFDLTTSDLRISKLEGIRQALATEREKIRPLEQYARDSSLRELLSKTEEIIGSLDGLKSQQNSLEAEQDAQRERVQRALESAIRHARKLEAEYRDLFARTLQPQGTQQPRRR